MSEDHAQFLPRQPGAFAVAGVRQSDQKHCFSCGRLVHASATSCPSCGAVQAVGGTNLVGHLIRPADAMFCYGCGRQIHAAAMACPSCGAPQRGVSGRATKDRTVAIVLAFLLGGVGAHRFYLGSPGWGIVYVLFCWTLIPAFAAMIEGLIYLSTSDGDFARKYS